MHNPHDPPPTLRLLSLGAEVQSSTLFLFATQRAITTFEDAVGFDAAMWHGHAATNRSGMPLHGTYYLHPSRTPLDQVDLIASSGHEPKGCSPWSCCADTAPDTATGGEAL